MQSKPNALHEVNSKFDTFLTRVIEHVRVRTRVGAVERAMTVHNNPRVLVSVLIGFDQVVNQPRALLAVTNISLVLGLAFPN